MRELLRANDWVHSVHLNGRSPVCMRMCLVRSLFCVNDWVHSVHLNGRSPVCVRMCFVRSLFCANDWLHSVHLYGRSPVCVRHVPQGYTSFVKTYHILHTCVFLGNAETHVFAEHLYE